MKKFSLVSALIGLTVLSGCAPEFMPPESDAGMQTTPPPVNALCNNGRCDGEDDCPRDCQRTPPPAADAGTVTPPPSVQCQAGLNNCSNTCCNLRSDNANCGACGNTCAGGTTCQNGSCAPTSSPPVCYAPNSLCGSLCTNVQADGANCGQCGRGCLVGQICSGGVCRSTTPPPATCNVSACTTRPNSNPACVAGACGFACYSSYGNCDDNALNGCETALTTNSNCGRCGNVCTGGTHCESGTCTSAPPPPVRYLRARFGTPLYVCIWDLNASPRSSRFCSSTAGGELLQSITGPFWPGNHIRVGLALDNPETTDETRIRWVNHDLANIGRNARQLGYVTLQIEQAGVATEYLLDSAEACLDVCHPQYPSWQESKVTVRQRPEASTCPATCDGR